MFDFNVVIIGGGPAGLTAGLYLSRAKIRTLLIEEESYGGKIKNLDCIENYPGFSNGISGAVLASEMQNQAVKYGLSLEIGKVTGIEVYSSSKCVTCSDGRSYTTAAVIIAGGSRPKKLGVPGEEKYRGKGVINCALCDGGQFEKRVVGVCGGGDSGLTGALYLTRLASKVILLEAMPALTASAIMKERALANPKIEIHTGTRVEAVVGEDRVKGIAYLKAGGEKGTLPVDGLLVQIGLTPSSSYLQDIVPLDKGGQVVVNEKMETEVPLIFAAGDIRSGSPGQVSTAVGDGARAAISAIEALQKEEIE
jgi:thioredoxin reductase (NADPH)